MRTEPSPRPGQPGGAAAGVGTAAATSSRPAIVASNREDFSPSELSRVATPEADTASSGMPSICEHMGAPRFRPAFSMNFARTLDAAHQALWSSDNIEHLDVTGRLSPAACKAVYRLVSVVALKSSDDHASVAARWAFREDKLTPDEERAWIDFASRLPTSFLNEEAPSSTWKPADTAELRTVLAQDTALAGFLDEPQGKQFVNALAQAMHRRSAEMKPSDRGMAFTMQFAHAYGVINHIVGGSFWRDAGGRLQMQLIHQESFPPLKSAGNIGVGRVYDRLDTSADHPEKRSTMVESMKLAGLPSVNLFPCPAPEMLVPFTQLLMAVGYHPYGPTAAWNNDNRGSLPPQRAFECCFDVTSRALHVMNQLMAPRLHLLPDNIDRLQYYASIAPGQFDQIQLGTGKQQRTIAITDMGRLPFKDQYAVFKEVGAQWGRIAPWDVERQTDSKIAKLSLKPGQQGIALRPGQRFKLVDRVRGLTLDGKPVGPERAYTAEEGGRMQYAGEKAMQATAVITAPRGQLPAKL